MKHIVMFSGGVGSWATAKQVAEKHGTDDLILLFTDTLIEDEDLYRFLDEAAANVGGELVKIADGRDPWQVFFDTRFLGNSRIAKCSHLLKQNQARGWVKAHFEPGEVTVYLGIDWTEEHRAPAVRAGWEPYTVELPLCDPPRKEKADYLEELKAEGIEPPRLYCLTFPHNNCGGFCVRAGQAQFALLLRAFPERYRYHERKEQAIRDYLQADVSILKDRRGGDTRPLTLKEFRNRLERGQQYDLFEWGGCACFA